MKKLKKEDEINITDRAAAREIVQVVLDYGVNQQQIYHMIGLLAMELENIDDMKAITALINNNSPQHKKTGLITGELK